MKELVVSVDDSHPLAIQKLNKLENEQLINHSFNHAFPKISVITTCYNHAQFIEATIQSVIQQDYPNLEFIVIDGGSSDGSLEIINRYQAHITKILVEPNTLQIHKLVKGFQEATGDIFCMLNSDDLFEKRTFARVVEFFHNNSEALAVYGNTSWIDEKGNLIRRKKEFSFNKFIFLYGMNYIPQPSVFWRRELHEKIGGISQDFELAMDADLWTKFTDVTTLHHVSQYWSLYRVHSQQKSHKYKQKMEDEFNIIRQRYISKENDWVIAIKQRIARLLYIWFKLINGCYF